MRSILIVALVFLTACVSEPLPDGFKDSNDFDPIVAAKNRISLGLTYLRNGDFSQAKFNLDKALQFAPRLADAHYSMAYYYQQVDEIELADDAYQKAIDYDPKNADIANSYGAFLCENGDYTEAKKYFLKAVNSSNYISTAETYENLALCSQSQGQIDDAITYLQSAINHQPSRGKSLMLLVELQMQKQQWEEAKLNLRRYEKVARVSADSLWKSIEIENALNNTDLAKGYGDMLVRMYPTDARALQYIKNKRGMSNVDVSGKITRQLRPGTMVVAQPSTVTNDDMAPSPTSSVENSLPSNNSTSTKPVVIVAPVAVESEATQIAPKQPVVIVTTPETTKGSSVASEKPTAVPQIVAKPMVNIDDKPIESSTRPNLMDKSEQDQSDLSSENSNASQGNSPEQDTGVANSLDTQSPRFHVVAKGENLYRISLKYNVKMQRLMEWNDIQEGDAVVIGRRLLVVDPTTVE